MSSSSSYKQALRVYGDPKQLSKILIKQSITRKINQPTNNELDLYYEIQRKENEAARIIQSVWKRSRRLLPWRWAVYALFAIVKIQKVIRGWVTRRYVARWFTLRTYHVTRWQSCIRKYLSNLHDRPRLTFERKMIIRIQCFIRQVLARLKCQRILQNLAATRIQALWRGVVDRSIADRKWLDKAVIPIQNTARRFLAMKKFTGQHHLLYQAALTIQRKFRSTLASRKISEILHQREMNYRLQLIKMLTTEEEFYQQKIIRVMQRVIKNEVKEKADNALKQLQSQEESILVKENEFIELKRHAESLSPRALEQGFRDELHSQSLLTRKEITDLKYKHLFEMSMEVHQCEENLQNAVYEIEDLAAAQARVSRHREQEFEDRRHLDFHRNRSLEKTSERKAIADERRKWQIKFYTKSGKPDKRRRPGRPWDPSVFAGPEKSTYSGAVGVDLLAFVKKDVDSDLPGRSTDVNENVNKAMNKVTLQTYLEQVNTYQQLLNPLFLILQQHMGLAPKTPNETVNHDAGMQGFGEEGQKFKEALFNLDVQPPPRTRLKTRGKTGYTTYSFQSSRNGSGGSRPKMKRLIAMDEDLGFDPPTGFPRTSPPHSPSRGSDDGKKSLFSSQSRRSIQSRNISTRESIEDVQFQTSDFSEDQPFHELDEKIRLSPGATSPINDHVSLDSIPLGLREDDDTALLRPMMEGVLLPSKRYWKRPAKKYLPTDDAFSIQKPLRSAGSALSMSSSGNLSGTRLSTAKSEHEVVLHEQQPVKKLSQSLTALGVLKQPDPLLEMTRKVALEQQQKDREREEKLQNTRELRRQQAEVRNKKKAGRRRVGAIPWDLLDEIDGATTRLEGEIAYVEQYHKF